MATRYMVYGLFMFLTCNAAMSVETVRVDASSGAPRLVVDGKPVRARVFWGAPGTRPLPVAKVGGPITFEFSPTEDEPAAATMHFRFGTVAGDVYLDDIRVVDLGTGQDDIARHRFPPRDGSIPPLVDLWPPGAQNTVGSVSVEPGKGRDGSAALHIALSAPPTGNWPDFHIYHQANLALRKGHRYRVSLWARAEPPRDLNIAFYRPGEKYVFLGGPPGVFESQIRMAAEAGVNFVSFPVDLPWPKPGQKADWSAADGSAGRCWKPIPQALLLPRIGMDPPAWWRSRTRRTSWSGTRGHRSKWAWSSRRPTISATPPSGWRPWSSTWKPASATHMAGYHPVRTEHGRMVLPEHLGIALERLCQGRPAGMAGVAQAALRRDAALRAAWRDPQVTLDSAAVPSPAARRAAPAGVLRDPAGERPLIDFAEFQQQVDGRMRLPPGPRRAAGLARAEAGALSSTATCSSSARSPTARPRRAITPCGGS